MTENQMSDQSAPRQDADEMIKLLDARCKASEAKWEVAFKEIDTSRAYAKGYVRGRRGKGAKKTTANMVYATLQGVMPYVFATNPEIGVRPAMQVDADAQQLPLLRKFSRTMESVLNRSMKESTLKASVKRMVRAAMTSKVGWIKVDYQRDLVTDNVMPGRQDDAQVSIARAQGLATDLQDGKLKPEQEQVRQQQLEDLLVSLHMQTEARRQEGIVVDHIPTKHIRMDPSVSSLLDYLQAGWLAFYTEMGPDDVMAKFGLTREQVLEHTFYPVAPGDGTGETRVQVGTVKTGEKVDWEKALLRVWELWDKTTNTIYLWADGGKHWLKEPHPPATPTERFYPFFQLGFNWIDDEEWPDSDVEFLMRLQDEYQSTRVQQAKHRELSKPKYVADKERTNEQDLTTFTLSSIGEVVLVSAGGLPVDNVFKPAQTVPYNPSMYDTTPIRADFEWVSGLGDAQRGAVAKTKTATEAGYLQQGMMSRIEEKQDTLEELLTEVALYIAQILLQELPVHLVQRFAGQSAVWPQTTNKWFLYNMLEIEIRAGSTGKPNKEQEQEQWAAVLPQILDTMDKALTMAIQYGIPIEANPYVQLLRETLRRFDERIDVTEFFGPMFGQVGQIAQQHQMQMQAATMQGQAAMEDQQAESQFRREQRGADAAAEREAQQTMMQQPGAVQ